MANVPTLRFPGFTDEWQKYSLGEYFTFKNGLNPDAKRIGRGVKFISVMDILNNNVITYSLIRDSVEATEDEISTYGVKYGDILFQRSSETLEDVGHANVYLDDKAAVYGGFVIRGRAIKEYNPVFMKYALASPINRKRIIVKGAGAQHFNIGQDGLSKVQVMLPDSKEQNRIAALFALLDERIALQSRLIDRLKSLMDGIRHRLFEKSTVYQSLGNIVEIRKGKQINGSELLDDGEYPVMNGGITPSGFLNEYNTPPGTISISEGGNSCGYVQFNATPIWSGGHCYTLHLICGDIDYRYLYHFLKHSESEIMKLRIGSGLPNIQKKDLLKFPITSYPISNQMKISKTLDVMEARILNGEFMLQSYAKLKAYLLSVMFI